MEPNDLKKLAKTKLLARQALAIIQQISELKNDSADIWEQAKAPPVAYRFALLLILPPEMIPPEGVRPPNFHLILQFDTVPFTTDKVRKFEITLIRADFPL